MCHQVGGANFIGMTQIEKTEMRNALKVTFSLALPPFGFFHSRKRMREGEKGLITMPLHGPRNFSSLLS